MKTIYVDVTTLLRSNFVTGIQRVTIEFLKRILKKQSEYRVVLLKENDANSFYKVDLNRFIKQYVHGKCVLRELVTREYVTMDDMASNNSVFFEIDSVWSCVHSRIDLYEKLKKRNIRIVTLVHDAIPISHPQYVDKSNLLKFPPYIIAVLKYCDVVINTTQHISKQMAYYAEKAGITRKIDRRVVPLGSDFAKTTIDYNQVSKRAKLIAEGNPYIFMVSTIEPRKNQKVLIDAFDQELREMGIQLVLAGRRGWNVDELMERIDNHPEKEKSFHHLEGENDETIRFLYQNAFMVFFPTYMEGYGLATVEAMQQHTPVAVSDIPVMREVGGAYCDYFDPDSPQEVINIVKKYLSDSEAYQQKKEKLKEYIPFTWDDMAEMTRGILLEDHNEEMSASEVS